MKKKIIVIISGLLFCALLVAAYFIGVRLFFPNSKELSQVYTSCMATKPGVTLDELKKMFVSAGIEHDHVGMHEYWFGSYEYSVLKSAYIVATVNKATGQVVRLSCGEGALAWDVEAGRSFDPAQDRLSGGEVLDK